MESAGARLKKIRLEKGLSLEEAHKKTRIHLDILKAIEEDTIVNLSPVYQKGFLKIYCRFLGVDPRDYIADYKESHQPAVKPISAEREKESLSLMKTASDKLESLRPHLKTKRIFAVIAVAIFSTALFYLGKIISFKRTSTLAKKSEITTVVKKETKTPPSGKAEKTQAPTKVTKAQPAEIPSPDKTFGIKLGIRAKEDCYLQLKADSKVIFQGVLKKGKSENWEAKEKIELSVGNAGAVELEVNGKLISSLGRRGQMRKNILITKDGLTVER